MDENAKKARRAYASAWRAANKDKVREYNQRYWKRKAEQMQQNADQKKKTNHLSNTRISSQRLFY